MAVPLPLAEEVEDEGWFHLEGLDLKRKVAEELEEAAQEVATDVGRVIERCEAARAELGKAAALLRLEPAAIFHGPGPLADHIGEAAELVRSKFSLAPPEGGEMQAARRELLDVILVSHPEANSLFDYYVEHFDAPLGGEDAPVLWDEHYYQAGDQAREALRRLDAADEASRAAHQALDLCQGHRAAGEPPGTHLSDAEVKLERAIHEVGEALTELRAMQDSLEGMENAILAATGEAP